MNRGSFTHEACQLAVMDCLNRRDQQGSAGSSSREAGQQRDRNAKSVRERLPTMLKSAVSVSMRTLKSRIVKIRETRHSFANRLRNRCKLQKQKTVSDSGFPQGISVASNWVRKAGERETRQGTGHETRVSSNGLARYLA